MKPSRSYNVARNAVWAVLGQLFYLLMSFIGRTVFVKMLGDEYLGINGLFSNILAMLSFAELGVGNAIIYSMYLPLAREDNVKLKSLMDLYKKAYRIIGIAVAALGVLVIPFLGFIIKDPPQIKESLTLIYCLFLFNTVISYFYTYKKSILIADQKNYVVNNNNQIFNFIQVILQIIVLVVWKDIILYLVVQCICTVINNIVIGVISDKQYPFLKEKNIEPLEKEEKDSIFTNIKSLVLYKLGTAIMNGTDNIIISRLIGVRIVGLYSNYSLIMSAFTSLISKLMESFTASVGNLTSVGEKKRKEEVFNDIYFISVWIYGFCSIGIYLLINPFIADIWFNENYILSSIAVFSIVLSFYVNGVRYAGYTYRNTLGLFKKSRYVPLFSAILNIILSIWLGNIMGLEGIFFATTISRLLTTGIVDPVTVYRYEFEKSPVIYFVKYVFYFLVNVILGCLCQYVLSFITIDGLIGFIINCLVVTLVYNVSMIIIFFRQKEFKDICRIIRKLIKK